MACVRDDSVNKTSVAQIAASEQEVVGVHGDCAIDCSQDPVETV